MNTRTIYRSSSGDTWDLVKDGDEVFVRHTPNRASGGAASRRDLATFLASEPHTAQNVALVRMIGGLVEPAADAGAEAEGVEAA